MRWGTDQIRLMLLRIEPISLYTILANHYIGMLTLISLIVILYTLLHGLRFQHKTHDILRYPHTPRDVNRTVYGYGRTPYGEYTAFSRTVS